jgi:2-polyprenyl-3-methyl-5-hydroxy-6-metoxy-1,4-benzoquinol methylase
MRGGYDEGYKACTCFWGRQPGRLVIRLYEHIHTFAGLRVLDVGCGEGKNAAFLAGHGAEVSAIDVSAAAIRNAKMAWPELDRVAWEVADISALKLTSDSYDVVVLYGILHCLDSADEVRAIIERLGQATRAGGYHVVCAFNDRRQELHAHPGFSPTLLKHEAYLDLYRGWHHLFATDTDLYETHPHNNIPHTHSMTRIIAQKED